VERRVFASATLARVVHKKFTLANARGGEGVRLDDVRAGFEEAPMDVANDLRLRERVEVAIVLEVLPGVLEPLAANLRLAQAVVTNRRPHGAVNDDDALPKQAGERVARARFGLTILN